MKETEAKSGIDFIGIGASKSATTWIHRCLAEHPDICASNPKEINYFFNNNYNRYPLSWYLGHFSKCPKESVRGEFSPEYLYSADIAERIKTHFPDVKLIACLRNPIERAISARFYDYSRGRKTLEKAEAEAKQIEADEKGLYGTHLEAYVSRFPREHIFVAIYEDIEKDPVAFMQSIYAFLGVDHSFIPPSAHRPANVSAENELYFHALKRWYYRAYRTIRTSAISNILIPLCKAFGIVALTNAVLRLNTRTKNITPLKKDVPKAVRRRLQTYYKADIAKLEKLLGRELTHWR